MRTSERVLSDWLERFSELDKNGEIDSTKTYCYMQDGKMVDIEKVNNKWQKTN